ncbi:ABC-2 type transport system ATP-binding protein [Streptoalloteichus tenebrarius]|uniref:ABC-2 type transport system ATP-binding protein n=1 Tax=Streptoalloteichus tenebrarius (strain ATCC 17920 / DSM 40477 / JCM 4838 / CBS 697.72 / NBRC 16177 / NCIMB 11028 / NRRL B-12390 / A12253. 1 / ISP 5477) TaxID=1933 RepID=A0ABT1I3G9_STRSD|nr:ABC transporter ATP-binding protein [Streptoalloteichus tenebrarius]MCP2262336.1 ABC-2 type transport system ATP-binding protein [Streptoalloteichus tenebrarius]BFF02062.1 ABC transporter ATP-binding protein [Streptoalloteichus tenebrarius]
MIEAVGLTKRYGRTVAVNELSFTVRPGRVTGFLGPNGAGKSTTMRMILGLDRPTAGDVLIDGRHYRDLHRPLRHIGALLDAKWVHPNRSARAHLRWLARSNGLPRGRVEEVLELVGLASVADRNAGAFSLGMAQRLGIAAALLGDPQILLFDEPVNGLDPEGIHWIRQLMRRLAAEGRTVFVSSHLLSEMAQTADELVVIGKGRLIAQSGAAEFVERASGAAVRVRSPQLERLRTALASTAGARVRDEDDALVVTGLTSDQVGEVAAAQGVVLHELSPQRGSLEEAFIRMTSGAVEYHAEETGEHLHLGDAGAEGQR